MPVDIANVARTKTYVFIIWIHIICGEFILPNHFIYFLSQYVNNEVHILLKSLFNTNKPNLE